MIPLHTLSIFFAASIALALAPGPDNIFVLTQSARYGYKAGVLIMLGLCSGLIVHTTAVSLGVAAVFQTSPLAFHVLKITGAVYLLYLAWQAFQARASALDDDDTCMNGHQLYVQGVIMNITNPKVAIFFLAFLPQFTDPSYGSIRLQMLMLGGVFMIAGMWVFSLIVWGAGFIREWFKASPRAPLLMNRIAGVVFIGLALRLLISE